MVHLGSRMNLPRVGLLDKLHVVDQDAIIDGATGPDKSVLRPHTDPGGESAPASGGDGVTYTVVLLREEEGGYSVSVPALKGCHTQGESLGEALLMAEEAIRLYLEVWVEDGKPIPADTPSVTVNMEEATEALVYRLTVRELASVA
jgi:antitoxin HicB